MSPSKMLLLSILISLVAAGASSLGRGTGKATLSFATKMQGSDSLNIAEKDRARAYALKKAGHLGKRSTSVSVTNALVVYSARVGVGSPPAYYTLLVDTGSSNTWVGASKPYIQTNTSRNTGYNVSAVYGSGNFSGEEWIDTITLASDLVITNQSIGVASSVSGFKSFDGILGLGPVDLTFRTDNNGDPVPTVLDNLFSQGTISTETLAISYVPASEPNSNGTLTFGGYDSSVNTSLIEYFPLTTTSPASRYWGINQSITYNETTILSSSAGIVDAGTTLILIASDAFKRYEIATGATIDDSTGLLTITQDQYANLQILSFQIGSNVYDLSPNAQIWPRSLNIAIGGSSSKIYLVVNDIGNITGSGLDFINGYSFLERFYGIFDTTNQRIGLASTAYTNATTN